MFVKARHLSVERTQELLPMNARLQMNHSNRYRGIAYVDYSDEKQLDSAIAKFNGMVVDGEPILATRSTVEKRDPQKKEPKERIPRPKKEKVPKNTDDCEQIKQRQHVQLMSDSEKQAIQQDLAAKKKRPRESSPQPPKFGRPTDIKRGQQWEYKLSPRPEKCDTAFVTNLAFEATEDEVKNLFQDCGTIKYLNLVKDSKGVFKGIAFVQYTEENAVDKAVKLNGQEMCGRLLRVDYAQPYRPKAIRERLRSNGISPSPTALLQPAASRKLSSRASLVSKSSQSQRRLVVNSTDAEQSSSFKRPGQFSGSTEADAVDTVGFLGL